MVAKPLPLPPPPPVPPLLSADATELLQSSVPLLLLFSEADECVFVSGIQSYTLKSMSLNDILSLDDDDGSSVVVVGVVGFLTILNFFISFTSVDGKLLILGLSFHLFFISILSL